MHTLRKIMVGVCATLLTIMLINIGFLWSARQTVGSQNTIKSVLKQSGIYEHGIEDVISQSQKQNTSAGQTDIPLSQSQIQTIIRQAFPPEYVQTQTEQVINAIYDYAKGKTQRLTFSVDLSEPKIKMADGIQQYVQQRLAALPACTPAETLAASQVNPFDATCLPAGVKPADVAAKERDNIINGDFLKDTVITADTEMANGQSLSQELNVLPSAYRNANLAFYGLIALTVLVAAGVILLSANWRLGVRKVAIIAVCIAVFSALCAWAGSAIVHAGGEQAIKTTLEDQPFQQRLIRAIQLFITSFRNSWFIYAAIAGGVGVVALIVLGFTKNKQPTTNDTNEPPETPMPQNQPTQQSTASQPEHKKSGTNVKPSIKKNRVVLK